MKTSKLVLPAAIAAVLVVFSIGAQAQATRTWVSGVGDDANPCSRTAACKTFAVAISKTAAGGEISVMDPGAYGTVNITKSLTINGGGEHASILALNTNGIIVNAADVVVTIRNVSIQGVRGGSSGIRFLAGAQLTVENVDIRGFDTNGIEVASGNTGALIVKNTVISDSANAINIGGGSASLNDVNLQGGTRGLNVTSGAVATISNSVISHFTTAGISSAGSAQVNAESTKITNNGTGISADGTSTVRMSNLNVFNNTVGIARVGTTSVLASFLNNKIAGNGTNGTPTVNLANQ